MVLWEHELPSVEPDRLRIVIGTDDSLIDTASVVDCALPPLASSGSTELTQRAPQI
jgi:hypothetical protein